MNLLSCFLKKETLKIRNKKMGINAAKNADKTFTRNATFPSGRYENIFARSMYKGKPVGCGMPRVYAIDINSPLSPKYTEGHRPLR
jgi:hypothetical protein